MKKLCVLLLALGLLLGTAAAEDTETVILLSDDGITVNGEAIPEDASAPVFLTLVNETHEDVPESCRDVTNRVVNLAAAGSYRIKGTATDVQLAVRAGESDAVRIILDGADLTCRTAPAILCLSALETAEPGAYGVTIELAEGSENRVTGSHTTKDETGTKYDGAIDSMVSLGFVDGDSLTEEEIAQYLGNVDLSAFDRMGGRGMGGFGGMGGRQGMASSSETGTADFVLSRDHTGFTSIVAAE